MKNLFLLLFLIIFNNSQAKWDICTNGLNTVNITAIYAGSDYLLAGTETGYIFFFC
jgi:hypothetical protein